MKAFRCLSQGIVLFELYVQDDMSKEEVIDRAVEVLATEGLHVREMELKRIREERQPLANGATWAYALMFNIC